MLDYDFVARAFSEAGCELLEDHYVNARTKMRYRCSCGNISEIVWYSFKIGNRCRRCGNRKIAEKLTLSHEAVAEYFAANGCTLLERYRKNTTPMAYRCQCGRLGKISWNNFHRGRRCKTCGISRRSGDLHYCWKTDRDRFAVEKRFRQLPYRIFKLFPETRFPVTIENLQTQHGYTFEEFYAHLVSAPDWEELRDTRWQIDHIWPVSAFAGAGISDIALINSLDNLRVVRQDVNCRKSACYNPVAFVQWLLSKGVPLCITPS